MLTKNYPLFFEACKVAYESAYNTLKLQLADFLDDPLLTVYASMLKTGSIDKNLGVFIANLRINLEVTMLESHWQLIPNSHFVIITYVIGIGLIAIVCFFEMNAQAYLLHVLILSVASTFRDTPTTLWINPYTSSTTHFIDKGIFVKGGLRF